jgi:hypothetical protein
MPAMTPHWSDKRDGALINVMARWGLRISEVAENLALSSTKPGEQIPGLLVTEGLVHASDDENRRQR